jgi:hypothetical protein
LGELIIIQENDRRGIPLEVFPDTPNRQGLLLRKTCSLGSVHRIAHYEALKKWVSVLIDIVDWS